MRKILRTKNKCLEYSAHHVPVATNYFLLLLLSILCGDNYDAYFDSNLFIHFQACHEIANKHVVHATNKSFLSFDTNALCNGQLLLLLQKRHAILALIYRRILPSLPFQTNLPNAFYAFSLYTHSNYSHSKSVQNHDSI